MLQCQARFFTVQHMKSAARVRAHPVAYGEMHVALPALRQFASRHHCGNLMPIEWRWMTGKGAAIDLHQNRVAATLLVRFIRAGNLAGLIGWCGLPVKNVGNRRIRFLLASDKQQWQGAMPGQFNHGIE